MNLSLSRFFESTPATNLDTCDREPVHMIGMIQKGTGLLVLDPADGRIVGVSENLHEILGKPADALLGAGIGVLSEDIAEQLAELADSPHISHEILDAQFEADGAIYDVVTHAHAGRRFVEFIRNEAPSASLVRKRMRRCGSACSQIMGALTFEEAMQVAANAVRDLTGMSRVKIYRFLPDWSGATIAESRDDRMVPMLGMHFPDTDIPKQVRELMIIVPYRFVGSVQDENVPIRALAGQAGELDMTWSMGRAVSVMHTAYLRNIGASSSFSCSLMDKGKLWGLIACHHVEEAIVPSDSWALAQEIGTALMLRYDQAQRTETADMISHLRRIESNFAAELRQTGDVEDVIKTLVPVLQKFLRADGFAFQYGLNLHTSGETPPPEFIRDLIRWTKDNLTGEDQFQTISLQSIYPDSVPYKDVACGVLVQPIVVHRVCQLIWFRGPITQKVAWAGRPDAKMVADEKTGVTLGPRTSFDKWVNEHNDQSLPWEEAELQAAREIFQEFLDIISSQLLLKEENSSLRRFAHMAAHDLKAPLRGISSALQWMEEDEADPASVEEHRHLAAQQAKKLQRLTESLLELAVLQEQKAKMENADLGQLAQQAVELLGHDIAAAGADVQIGGLPSCVAAPDLLIRVFLNLIGNALKYGRSADRALRIAVTSEEDGSWHRIVIEDNGPGIPPQFAEQIFEPSQRLVTDDKAEGSGFGLSICAEIAKLHYGRIFADKTFEAGARFVLELPKAQPQ
ncbi:ATP-binding protein [Leisingera aquaemixtae]|uniref:histidine kinase n=1 Tax=Leisingera aquaemixtae TaxID=1396826 RepID=A0A0P1HAU2_9RHOB|nr:ATP-binding protein [Leisingera aquaemixtae]CUI00593.1 Phytochrome-like protein cph1 [Leisingera aquaemixtae]